MSSEKKEKKEKKDAPKERKSKKDGASKEGLMFKATKNITGKVATSGFGKAVIKKVLDEETNKLMTALKKLIEQQNGKKKASEVQNNIIKIMLKAQFQIEKKNIKNEDFIPADKPLRRAFRHLCKLNEPEYYSSRSDEEKKTEFQKVEASLKKVGAIVATHISPYLTDKNKQKIEDTINYLTNPEFMRKIWEDPKAAENRQKLCSVMKVYNAPTIHLDQVEQAKESESTTTTTS